MIVIVIIINPIYIAFKLNVALYTSTIIANM